MKLIFKLIKKILSLVAIALLAFVAYEVYDGYKLYQEKVEETPIKNMVASIRQNENYVSYEELPDDLINATVAIEDHRFFEHNGLDIVALARALVTNISDRQLSAGGSTITQQLAKNMYFSFEKKLSRKVAEAFVTYNLEKMYSKEEILELYLNVIYYGDGYYGIKAAANGYFSKEVNELTLDEITLLAGLPNAPSVYQLSNENGLAYIRQEYVVEAMEKYLSEQ